MGRDEACAALTIEGGHTVCELLKDCVVTKIYLDYDAVLEGLPRDSPPTAADLRPHTHGVVNRTRDIVARLSLGAGEDADIQFVIASRHGWCEKKNAWKVSFRPFIVGVRIRYDHIPIVLRSLGQLEDAFWDMSVYKPREQLLAAINGRKSRLDGRVLRPDPTPSASSRRPMIVRASDYDVPWTPDILEYVAQVVSDDWPLMRVPDAAVVPVPVPTQSRSTMPEAVLRSIVCALDDRRALDRKPWIEVLWAVHAVSTANGYVAAGEAIAHEFSRRCPAKYDVREVTKAFHSGRVDGENKFDIGSLLYWLKADDPTAFAAVQARLRSSASASASASQSSHGGAMFVEDDDDVIVSASRTHSGDAGAATAATAAADAAADAEAETEHVRCVLMRQFMLRWPERFGDLVESDFAVTVTGGVARFAAGDVRGTIEQDFVVKLGDGSSLGMLCPDVPVNGPLTTLHRDIPPGLSFVYNRESDERATLRSVTPDDATITVFRTTSTLGQGGAVASINVRGRREAIVDNGKKIDSLSKWLELAVRRHVQTSLGPLPNNIFISLVNNGTINVNVNVDATANDKSDFAVIRVKLLDFAAVAGLRKRDGVVFAPLDGCPCAYVTRCSFEDYINEVLQGDSVYTSNPKRFDEALKYMKNYRDPEMPVLVTDRDLLSFRNGIVQLSTGVFTSYSSLSDGESRVARHHISASYLECTDTPLLDAVLLSQFDVDVADLLLALLGRALFAVGQLDAWQVMPYLVGIGGTGKSLILNVVQRLFAPGAVGNLAAKREDVFGMANLVDKELVMGRDMPAKLSGSLPQEIMQAMTAGEGMEIPRKGQVALNVTWSAPVIMASNHMPDYVNTGNNVGRRLVTFRFDHVVSTPQEGLQEAIVESELPNIVCRALRSYSALRLKVKAVGGFWKAVPGVMLEWQSRLAASTNKLHAFFAMDDEERGFSITKVEGCVTWLLDFKAAFEKKMGAGTYVADPAVFAAFGFRVSEKREKVCVACKQLAKARGGKCCDDYSNSNRTIKAVIFDMAIMPAEQEH